MAVMIMSRVRYKVRYGRVALVVVLLSIVAFAIYFYCKGQFAADGKSQLGNSLANAMTNAGILPSNDGLNILIIGNNARNAKSALSIGTEGGQADILIVAHIDAKKKEINLISIPRDTLIAMPEWNEPIPKIKSTFYLGLQNSSQDGADMAMKYVSGLTGMPIHKYVAVNFQGFVDAVNAVHGITIDVPGRLYDPTHSKADLYPGRQVLNGEQALAYVRIRQNEASDNVRVNDFQRQQAEMQVVQVLKEKIYHSYSDISELRQLLQILNKDVATDLNTSQVVSLANEVLSWKVNQVYLGSDKDAMDITDAPAAGFNSGNYLMGAYYDVLDPEKVYSTLKPYGAVSLSTVMPILPQPAEVPVRLYGPAEVLDRMKQAGFSDIDFRGAAGKAVSQDTITYPPGNLLWGLVVGRFTGSGNEVIQPGPEGLREVIYQVAK
jgi:LCP family protein required for cell wall assembly